MNSDIQFYSHLLTDIKTRIQGAQVRAMLAVNTELLQLYWEIGRLLHARQQEKGWGTGVIPKLAADLHNELPELKGFSERNLKRMLGFYRAYPQPKLFVPQAVAQTHDLKMPQLVAPVDGENLLWQIPWGHHALLLEKVKDPAVRCWYMMYSLMHGWSRNILAMQIETYAHQRQGRAVTNFNTRLLSPQSDLVQQTLKDPYLFDFLTLEKDFHERELETGLVRHVEKFLLQLGQGFAFVGRQYMVSVGEDDFYIDLLFYHLKLRCFVVIELKRGPFKPEYAGKINFYCNLVDDQLRHDNDHPTIGLLLCQDKNRAIAEYALRGIDKPIGVAEYQLLRELPETLVSNLPSIDEIEAEFGDEMSALETATLHLPERYLQMVKAILQTHLPNAEVWAYGSRVNGDYYEASDLDLVVRQPEDLSRQQLNLGEVIDAFSESNLPIIVQLVDWARIPSDFHAEIMAKYAVIQPNVKGVWGLQSRQKRL